MSLTVQSFLETFNFQSITITESFEEVKVNLLEVQIGTFDSVKFFHSLGFLNIKDRLQFSVMIGEREPVDFYSQNDPTVFIDELQRQIELLENEVVIINFIIYKNQVEERLSVYFSEHLLAYFESLPLLNLFTLFNQFIEPKGCLVLENQNPGFKIETASVRWVDKGDLTFLSFNKRDNVLECLRSSCHTNTASLSLIPEDFKVVQCSVPALQKIFNRLAIVLSVIALFDITSVTDNKVSYKLNGYKSISGEIDFKVIKPDFSNTYFQIYQWVYNEGNFNDKLGLARNIISLHIEHDEGVKMQGDPFRSLQSSYKVYEQDNIQK